MEQDFNAPWQLVPTALVEVPKAYVLGHMMIKPEVYKRMRDLSLQLYHTELGAARWLGLDTDLVHPHDRWLAVHIPGTAHDEPSWYRVLTEYQARESGMALRKLATELALERNLNYFNSIIDFANGRWGRAQHGLPPVAPWQVIAHLQLKDWDDEVNGMVLKMPNDADMYAAHQILHHGGEDLGDMATGSVPQDILLRMYGLQMYLEEKKGVA